MKNHESKELYQHCSALCPTHTVKFDMTICYPKQCLPGSVWLHEGSIIINQGKKDMREIVAPGFYLLDDFLRGRPIPYSVTIKAKSKIWIITKSELPVDAAVC